MTDELINGAASLGRTIRLARLQQGFTRDALALATGLSPKFISQVEAGKPTAQLGKVLQLLNELGVSVRAQIPELHFAPSNTRMLRAAERLVANQTSDAVAPKKRRVRKNQETSAAPETESSKDVTRKVK
ncbi:helix-turn-helix domain-containing protein [Pandoraea sputorum]